MTGDQLAAFAIELHREIVAKFGRSVDLDDLTFCCQPTRVVVWGPESVMFSDMAVAIFPSDGRRTAPAPSVTHPL